MEGPQSGSSRRVSLNHPAVAACGKLCHLPRTCAPLGTLLGDERGEQHKVHLGWNGDETAREPCEPRVGALFLPRDNLSLHTPSVVPKSDIFQTQRRAPTWLSALRSRPVDPNRPSGFVWPRSGELGWGLLHTIPLLVSRPSAGALSRSPGLLGRVSFLAAPWPRGEPLSLVLPFGPRGSGFRWSWRPGAVCLVSGQSPSPRASQRRAELTPLVGRPRRSPGLPTGGTWPLGLMRRGLALRCAESSRNWSNLVLAEFELECQLCHYQQGDLR